jgi:hypothetical protein
MVILLAVMLSASALLAAPRQALYSGKVVETHTNCGLTQVFGIVLDANGNQMAGTNMRLWWGGGPTLRTTAGKYGSAGASGWDFTLNTHPVANTWYVAVDDGGDIVLSDQIEVHTNGTCNSGDVNVVKVEIRHTPDGGGSSDSGGNDSSPPPSNPAPAPSSSEAAPPLTAGASCLWFTETAGGSGGFSVCDDGNARFYTAFAQYGLQNVGYPISQRFKRDGFITQAFQKAVFQWRADSNTVAFVNVFDELHNRVLDQRLLDTRQTPKQLPDGWDGGASFEEIKARRQALLNQRPALYSAYFSVSNPLLFFGLPTSEMQDMGNHYAIRLQRGVLQEWKENVPWASIGQVTVANGGDIAKEMEHFSASILTPESSPPAGATAGSPSSPQAPAPAPQPTQAPAQPSAATPSGFGYGIQAHMIYLDKGPIYASTKSLGFNWLKQQIEWKAWEGSQGNIDWGEMDAIIDGAGANGISMLFSIVGAPGWAREGGYDASVAGPPSDPNTFAAFNGAVAGRYCGKALGAIEVWNEQNLHYEWGNKPLNPADYVALLRPSYAAIKAACPSMIVVSGALTPAGNVGTLAIDDFSYLEGMLQNGLLNYADAVGSHPSGYNVPPNLDHTQACAYLQQKGTSFMGPCDTPHHSWSFRSTVDGYYDMVQRHGGGKLIWATEFGWAAGGAYHPSYAYANDNSYQEQADWTVEAYQYMRSSGKVGAAFLWNLNFRVIADQTEKAQWGILRNDGSPLPAYSALQAMPK